MDTRADLLLLAAADRNPRSAGGSREPQVFGGGVWAEEAKVEEHDAPARRRVRATRQRGEEHSNQKARDRGIKKGERRRGWRGGECAEARIPVGSRGPESYYEMLSERARSRNASCACLFAREE